MSIKPTMMIFSTHYFYFNGITPLYTFNNANYPTARSDRAYSKYRWRRAIHTQSYLLLSEPNTALAQHFSSLSSIINKFFPSSIVLIFSFFSRPFSFVSFVFSFSYNSSSFVLFFFFLYYLERKQDTHIIRNLLHSITLCLLYNYVYVYRVYTAISFTPQHLHNFPHVAKK